MGRADDILGFWFADASDDTPITRGTAPYQRWFGGGPELDAHITATFAADVRAARAGQYASWRETPDGALALVLLLDQFPRHVYRDRAAAFDSDEAALEIARACIERGMDEALPLCRRVFLYLPIQHSERLDDHDLALERFESLVHIARARGTKILAFCEAAVQAEVEHVDTLRQFGRYPYRNAALGRENTPAETAWLAARK